MSDIRWFKTVRWTIEEELDYVEEHIANLEATRVYFSNAELCRFERRDTGLTVKQTELMARSLREGTFDRWLSDINDGII